MITLSIESSAPHFVTTDRYNRFKKILQQPTSMLNADSVLFKSWLSLIRSHLPTLSSAELIIADGLCSQIAELLTGALQPVAALGSVDNPLAAITARLAGQNLHTLHLVAHGQAGTFNLGGQRIDAELLRANADLLAQWQVQRIALWSCSVGQDNEFIRLLSELTGAQVFAAEQPLGKLDHTHNWQLSHGFNQNPFSSTTLANWSYQLATFNFGAAYEVLKDRTPAGKESNTHDFDSAAKFASVTVDDQNVDSRYFSGNDVYAVGLKIGGSDYYGWISRPIKVGGVVKGFYFWTDTQFTSLAAAIADGNTDGDRDVTDNRGFILVVDETYFNNLSPISGTIKNVGSSSDRVDSALNALIQPEVKLTAVADTGIATEAGGINNGTAGSDATGNALTNDTGTALSKTITEIGTTAADQTVASGSTSTTGTTVTGQYGSLKIGADGSYSYAISNQLDAAIQALRTTANTLTDTFTYTVTDSNGLKSSTTLAITIQGTNDAPVANNDYNVAKESLKTDGTEYTGTDLVGKLAEGNVLSNDTDVDRYDETKTITGTSTSGSATGTTSGATGSATTLSFTTLPSNVSVGYYVFLDGDGVVGTSGAGTALKDASNNQITISAINTTNKTFTLSAVVSNVTLSGTPILGFANKANGSGAYKDAQISSAVSSTNTTVNLSGTITGTIASGMTETSTGAQVISVIYDTAGKPTSVKLDGIHTFTSQSLSFTGNSAAAQDISGNYGLLKLNSDGSYIYTPYIANEALAEGDTRTEVFNYTMQDAVGLQSTATLTISVLGSSGTSFAYANADTAIVNEAGGTNNQTAETNSTPTGNVLTNDSSTLTSPTVTVLSARTDSTAPSSATPVVTNTTVTGLYGTLTISSTGVYTYTVNNDNGAVQSLRDSNATLTENFVYTMQAVKNSTTLTSSATLKITIQGANDAPIAGNVAATAIEASGENNSIPGYNPSGNVLDYASDVDDLRSELRVTALRAGGSEGSGSAGTVGTALVGTYGSLTLSADGTWNYTVDNSNPLVNVMAPNDTLTDSFNYTVTDRTGTALFDTAVLNVTIQGAADNITVNDIFVNEASPYAVFTVTGDKNATVTLSLSDTEGLNSNDTKATLGTDISNQLQYYNGSSWVNYGTGTPTIPDNGKLLVRVAVNTDDVHEGNEAFTLKATSNNVSSIGVATINDEGDLEGNIYLDNTTGTPGSGTLDDDRPTISITSPTVNEGANAVFTVSIDKTATKAISFTPTLTGTGAILGTDTEAANTLQVSTNGGTDWTTVSGPVTIAAGQTSLQLRLATKTDTDTESNETFTLETGYISGTVKNQDGVTGTATIQDGASQSVSSVTAEDNANTGQTPVDSTVVEGNSLRYTVALSVASPIATEYSLAITGTATSTDYAAPSSWTFSNDVTWKDTNYNALTIPANVTSFTITVGTTDDSAIESAETLILTVGGQAGTGNITDNDSQSVSSVTAEDNANTGQTPVDSTVVEGNSLRYTVALSVASPTATEYSLAITGTATSTDYAAPSSWTFSNDVTWKDTNYNALTIPANVTSFTITVGTTDDSIIESAETMILTIGGVAGNGGIIDNDLLVTSPTVNEASPYAVFTVTGSVGQQLSLALTAGTATGNGTDFGGGANLEYSLNGGVDWIAYSVTPNPTLTGTTLLVRTPVIEDTIADNGETFTLTATPAGGSAVIGTATINDQGGGTIFNANGTENTTAPKSDDRALAVSSPTVNEASPYAVFTVTGVAGQQVTLALGNTSATTDIDATLGTDTGNAGSGVPLQYFNGTSWVDYTANSLVAIPAGSTTLLVRTKIINDSLNEGAETFTLTVTPNGGSAVVGTATIKDDGTGDIYPDNNTGATDPNAVKDDDRAINVAITAISEDSGTPGDFITNDSSLIFSGTATAGSSVLIKLFDANNTLVFEATQTAVNGVWSVDRSAFNLAGGSYQIIAEASNSSGQKANANKLLTIDSDIKVTNLDITDATDTGANDLITANGNPQLILQASSGLTLSLKGPNGEILQPSQYAVKEVPLLNGQSRYEVTLLDADLSKPGAQAFGDFANGQAAGNPANATDGTYQIIATTNTGKVAVVGEFIIDTVAPRIPTIDLPASSDSGSSDTDNITGNTVVALTGSAEPNSKVNLYRPDGQLYATVPTNQLGEWQLAGIDLTKIDGDDRDGILNEDGDFTFTAKTVDVAGNEGLAATLTLTLNRGLLSIDLPDQFDSGESNTDNLTNISLIQLQGNAPSGSRVQVKAPDGTVLGTVTADAQGLWTLDNVNLQAIKNDVGILADGNFTFSADIVDVNGLPIPDMNSKLTVTLDTKAPDTPLTLNLTDESDLQLDATLDDVTNIPTPKFIVGLATAADADVKAGYILKLYATPIGGGAEQWVSTRVLTESDVLNRTAFIVTDSMADGEYNFKVKLFDVSGNAKENAATFAEIRTDLDGVNAAVEDVGTGNGDFNDDGIADSLQNAVATFPVVPTEGKSGAEAFEEGVNAPAASFGSLIAGNLQNKTASTPQVPVDDNVQLKAVAVLSPNDPKFAGQTRPADKTPVTDPLQFTITARDGKTLTDLDGNPANGLQTRVVLEMPAGVKADTFIKFGPKTAGSLTNEFFEFLADGDLATFDDGAELFDTNGDGLIDRVVITLTDNGIGDTDPQVGVISDPGYLAVTAAPVLTPTPEPTPIPEPAPVCTIERDDDRDGINDHIEAFVLGAARRFLGDGNSDGRADATQKQVTSLFMSHWTHSYERYATFELINAPEAAKFSFNSLPQISPTSVSVDNLPFDILTVRAENVISSEATNFKFYVEPNQLMNGFLIADTSGELINFGTDSLVIDNGKLQISWQITENGAFDLDGWQNNAITVYGGAGFAAGKTAGDRDADGVPDTLEAGWGLDTKVNDNNLRQSDLFIAQMYRDLFDREVSSQELEAQLNLLKQDNNRVARIVDLASSAEFEKYRLNEAVRLFSVADNRAVTRQELDVWRTLLQNGSSDKDVISYFMANTSLGEVYRSGSNFDYLQALEQRILGRQATEQEWATMNDSLKTLGRAGFTQQMLAQPEFQQRTQAQLIATLIADLALSPEMLNHYSSQLYRGEISADELITLALDAAVESRFNLAAAQQLLFNFDNAYSHSDADLDGDGIGDNVESQIASLVGVPFKFGDGNGDGILDARQSNVVSMPVAIGDSSEAFEQRFITLEITDYPDAILSFDHFTQSFDRVPMQGDLPMGLLNFQVKNIPSDIDFKFKFYLEPKELLNGFWRQTADGQWIQYGADSLVIENGKLQATWQYSTADRLDYQDKCLLNIQGGPGFGIGIRADDRDNDGMTDTVELQLGLNPMVKDNDTDQDAFFIRQIYRDLYHREATQDELSTALTTFGNRTEQVLKLAGQPEFDQYQTIEAVSLFLATDARAITPQELDVWRTLLKNGSDEIDVIDYFMGNTALAEVYQNGSDSDYLQALDNPIFARELTAEEFRVLSDFMKTVSRAEFTKLALAQPEFLQANQSEATVIWINNLLNDISLNNDQLAHYSDQLDQGEITVVGLIDLAVSPDVFIERFMA
ncbi:MAG: VCBS domain-containing protein [Methylobacter sp.]|nr:VCBS domain-containing protein [Methylobacter sp.]